jgi:hypothetical protein
MFEKLLAAELPLCRGGRKDIARGDLIAQEGDPLHRAADVPHRGDPLAGYSLWS